MLVHRVYLTKRAQYEHYERKKISDATIESPVAIHLPRNNFHHKEKKNQIRNWEQKEPTKKIGEVLVCSKNLVKSKNQ